jgi:hypothetical protein
MLSPDDFTTDPEGRHLSLRFLSGRCKGSEYVLAEGENVVVGRSADADIILLEGIVSRRHASFALLDSVLSVEDLRSTNGTFVNGERVRRRRLTQGDRVLVGTSILKVVWSDAPVGTAPPRPAISDIDIETHADTAAGKLLTGSVEDMGVPELFEIFASSGQTGVLVLRREDDEARITIRAGLVEQVRVSSLPDSSPEKCLQRVLGWSNGTFIIAPYQLPQGPLLGINIRDLLVDALFKLDELRTMRERLLSQGESLALAQPCLPAWRDLGPAELELMQLVHNLGAIDRILDRSPETDWAAAQRLLRLVDGGYIRAR